MNNFEFFEFDKDKPDNFESLEIDEDGLDIMQFSFGETSVRTVAVGFQPWFIANDVCGVLGIKNARDALEGLDADERNTAKVETLGGPQDLSIVNEPGLYRLVFKSRKPEGKAFKRWVFHEVLPSIRKTGCYNIAAYGKYADCATNDMEIAKKALSKVKNSPLAAATKALICRVNEGLILNDALVLKIAGDGRKNEKNEVYWED